MYVDNEPEAIANAQIFVEAINISTETGLTPRQLADQRTDLLEALENLMKWSLGPSNAMQEFVVLRDAALAAIAKAKGEANHAD